MEILWKKIIGKGLFNIFFLVPLMLLVQTPVFLAGVSLATYLVYSQNLGEIPSLVSYEPKTVSTFFADDGTVIGSFFKQKRLVVALLQITRNFLLTHERRISRKIREIILALRLEKVWGKQKILYVYLNEIYLGEGAYGVEAAARGYFDNPVEHLTIAQAALIAGLGASPSRFNPFKNEKLARQRQLTVLSRILKKGFI